MSHIEDLVATLEEKIQTVISKNKTLEQDVLQLKGELAQCKATIDRQKQELVQREEQYETLKVANAMLGSDENKRETKLKINALVREIDYCIAQLAD